MEIQIEFGENKHLQELIIENASVRFVGCSTFVARDGAVYADYKYDDLVTLYNVHRDLYLLTNNNIPPCSHTKIIDTFYNAKLNEKVDC